MLSRRKAAVRVFCMAGTREKARIPPGMQSAQALTMKKEAGPLMRRISPQRKISEASATGGKPGQISAFCKKDG